MSLVGSFLLSFSNIALAKLPGTVSAYDAEFKGAIGKHGGIKSCVQAPKDYKKGLKAFKKQFNIKINNPEKINGPEGERQVYGLLNSLSGNPMTEKYLKNLNVSFVDTLENKKSNCGTAGVYKGGGKIEIPRFEPPICNKKKKSSGIDVSGNSDRGKPIPFTISTLAHEVGHHMGALHGHKHHNHNHPHDPDKAHRKNYKHYDGPENKFVVRSAKEMKGAGVKDKTDAKCKPSEYSYKNKKDRKELVAENFAEVVAGYWLHPEKSLGKKSSCNSQVNQMRAVFQAKRSPCANVPKTSDDYDEVIAPRTQASNSTGLDVGR